MSIEPSVSRSYFDTYKLAVFFLSDNASANCDIGRPIFPHESLPAVLAPRMRFRNYRLHCTNLCENTNRSPPQHLHVDCNSGCSNNRVDPAGRALRAGAGSARDETVIQIGGGVAPGVYKRDQLTSAQSDGFPTRLDVPAGWPVPTLGEPRTILAWCMSASVCRVASFAMA